MPAKLTGVVRIIPWSALLGTALSLPAAEGSDYPENADQMLEEIVITATRRETNLMQTPLAVSAFDQAALNRQSVKTARDLAGKIPNLQLGSGGDSGTATSVRGVSSTDFTEVGESAVSFHIDGAYSPRPQGALALMYDLERVEVLRGPQGTLFGMNSPGGGINIIPHQPDLDASYGSIEGALGRYNHYQVRGMLNYAVTDTLALRATFMTDKRDGMMDQDSDTTDLASPANGIEQDGIPDVDQRRNRKVGKEDFYNNSDQWGARLIALWSLTEHLEITGTYEHFSDQGAGDLDFVDCDQAQGTPYACTHDLRWASVNVPGRKDMDIDDYRLKLSYYLSDSVAMDYRVSFQDQERSQIQDLDGGTHPAASWASIGEPQTDEAWITWAYPIRDEVNETVFSDYETISHELQFKSSGESKLQYVAGLFYMKEDKKIRYDVENLIHKTFDPDDPDSVDGLPDTQVYNQPERTTESKAVFGQLDYALTEKITFTLGYRHTEDEKTDTHSQTYARWWGDAAWYNGEHTPTDVRGHQSSDLTWNMGGAAPLGSSALGEVAISNSDMSWSEDTYRLGAQYFINNDEMLFASFATGYKMGGMYEDFDICNNGCVELLTFDPEYVKTYELGYKGNLLDNRVRLSATLFFSDYTDMQSTGEKVVGVNQNPDSPDFGEPVLAWTTDNLGESAIKGLELEFDLILWRNGRLSGYAAWLDTEIKKASFTDGYQCAAREIYGQPLCGSPGFDTIKGNQLSFAPEFSVTLNYEHRLDFVSGFVLTPYVSLHWQDDMWLDNQNYDGAHLSQKQEAYTKIDASLRLDSPDETYYVELVGSNLTDEDTRNFHSDSLGVVKGSYDPPRLYSLRAGYRF